MMTIEQSVARSCERELVSIENMPPRWNVPCPSTTGEAVISSTRWSRQFGFRAGLIAVLASGALLAPQLAQAAPSAEDIARAQAEEDAAKMSVAQIEVRLAAVSSQADGAIQAAQIAAEEVNAANLKLDEAKKTATAAKEDADKAEANFEKGKQEIASIAQAAYRDGASSLDSLAPYFDSEGLRTVETKQASIDTFSASADAKMQRVAALEKVADVMKKAADDAVVAQDTATKEVQTRSNAAQSAAEEAMELQRTTAAKREVYVKELARKQNTTIALIEQRQAAIEAERRAAAEATARAAAEEAARQAAAEEAARQAAANSSQNVVIPDYDIPSYIPEPIIPDSGGASSGGAAAAIAAAKSYLGVPYVWAGESSSGVDCSGLTMLAYSAAGIYLPHYSQAQYSYGSKVSINAMQAGDLIFWSSNGGQSGIYHVAIYLGDGQMIEAPQPGSSVRITSIWGWSQLMPYAVRL